MAITSSICKGIIGSITIAENRHIEHQAPTESGCETIKKILTNPSGITKIPKRVTIHGIVRQREVPPIYPIRNSKVYASVPNAASDIGKEWDISESKTVMVPSPKKGSQA
jgi:hypothetical protein